MSCREKFPFLRKVEIKFLKAFSHLNATEASTLQRILPGEAEGHLVELHNILCIRLTHFSLDPGS